MQDVLTINFKFVIFTHRIGMKSYYQVGILKKQCVVAAQCGFTKEREFAMWTCDTENLKVITGPLKDLLVTALKLTMSDLGMLLKSAMEQQKNNKEVKIKKLSYGNDAFTSLSLHEKISAIHFVATHLFDAEKEAPELELWMDATIDVLFSRIESHILVFNTDKDESKFVNEIKKLVIKAYVEHFPKKAMEESNDGLEDGEDYTYEDRVYKINAHKIKGKEFWLEIIESLRDVILFNRDFEMFEMLEGLDLKVRDRICGDFGINLDRRLSKELLEKDDVRDKILEVLSMDRK